MSASVEKRTVDGVEVSLVRKGQHKVEIFVGSFDAKLQKRLEEAARQASYVKGEVKLAKGRLLCHIPATQHMTFAELINKIASLIANTVKQHKNKSGNSQTKENRKKGRRKHIGHGRALTT